MQLLDLTLEMPEENLALDEALLDEAEEKRGSADAVLRLWEPKQMFVVAGNSTRLADEVQLEACRARGVPVLRRVSGGATIVTGPGCLMYALVLSYERRPELRAIERAHRFVLESTAAALRRWFPVERAGISDLVFDGRKFSGNSLRCRRNCLLYHGTLLYDFPLNEIAALLKLPARQPDYRAGRSHGDFLTNLPLERTAVREALIAAFDAVKTVVDWPRQRTLRLAAEKYERESWNERM